MTAHARASSTNRARQPRGGLAALSGPIPNADLVRAARAGALASPTTPRSPLAGGLHLPQYPPSGARCEAREQHTERSYSEKLLHASSGIATSPTAERLTPRHSLASVARVFPNHLSCSPGLHGPGAPCARAPRPEHLFADTTIARRGESSANGAHALDATFATFAARSSNNLLERPCAGGASRLTPRRAVERLCAVSVLRRWPLSWAVVRSSAWYVDNGKQHATFAIAIFVVGMASTVVA